MFKFDENRKNVYFMLRTQEARQKLDEIIPISCLQNVVTFGYALGYPDALVWRNMSEFSRDSVARNIGARLVKENEKEVWYMD